MFIIHIKLKYYKIQSGKNMSSPKSWIVGKITNIIANNIHFQDGDNICGCDVFLSKIYFLNYFITYYPLKINSFFFIL